LNCGTFRIQGMLPSDKIETNKEYSNSLTNQSLKVANWPVIERRKDKQSRDENQYENKPLDIKIEPGEEDSIGIDFVIPSGYQTVRIYSYLKRKRTFWENIWKSLGLDRDSDYGWLGVSIYNLAK